MAFRCNNCNGSVVFDIASQQMKCENCGSMFIPESFQVRDSSVQTSVPSAAAGAANTAGAAECRLCGAPLDPGASICPYCGAENDQNTPAAPVQPDVPAAEMSLFTCQNCGAALESTEDSMIGFCPYCGGQSMLKTDADSGSNVERLIPFQITRAQCSEVYGTYAKKIRYLPKELKNPEFLQSFTGIYMPYYEYDVEFGQSNIQGQKTVQSTSSYEIINTYQIDAGLDGTYQGVPYDASKYLDDEIAARALPFNMGKARNFHPAYLSGFYADTATVGADIYYADAEAQASEDVVAEVASSVMQAQQIRVDQDASTVDAKTRGHHSVLFPMWFLTWRRNDRVAYAVVNGESGKVVSDLPVDMRAFGLGCGVIAAVLFLLLELMFQPTPLSTSVLSLIAALVMAYSIKKSTRQVYEKQTHANDKGWSGGGAEGAGDGSKLKTKLKKSRTNLPIIFLVMAVLYVLYMFVQLGAALTSVSVPFIVALLVLAYTVWSLRKIMTWQKEITEKDPARSAVILLVSVLLNAAIVFLSPVNDGWYYLGDAVCIVGLVLAAIGMIRIYNVGTTRPLPKLFDRNEV